MPQNANDIELCLRITNGKPALALLIGSSRARFMLPYDSANSPVRSVGTALSGETLAAIYTLPALE